MSRDEPPLKSRKFVAYLIAEMSWKILAGLVLFWGKDAIPQQVFIIMLAIVIVAGFVEVGYIIGQGSLDKYVRIAQIAAENGKSFNMKGLQVTASTPAAPKAPCPPEDKSESDG